MYGKALKKQSREKHKACQVLKYIYKFLIIKYL